MVSLFTVTILKIEKNNFLLDKLEFGKANDLFDELLKVFSCQVLPIHGVAHVQFIIFYIASFHEVIKEKVIFKIIHISILKLHQVINISSN